MTSVLRFPHVHSAKSRPDATALRERIRVSPIYRDMKRFVDLAEELIVLARELADELPGTPLAHLMTDRGETAAGHLTCIADVTETFTDLIDGDMPAL